MESKAVTSGSGSNPLRKILNQLRSFFFPVSNERKKRRYAQFRNVSIFFVSTILFMIFEDYISKLCSIDTSDLQKGMMGGPQPSPF